MSAEKYITWREIVLLSIHLICVRGKTCVTESPCKCTFDDNSGTVDLTSIGNTDGSALAQNVAARDGFMYSFNPCYPFSEGTCTAAAACQIDGRKWVYFNIGDSSSVAFSYDGSNVIATYIAPDKVRKSVVTYICDRSATTPQISVFGETAFTTYGFNVTSRAVCPKGGGTPDPGKVTIIIAVSVGTILTIISFSLLIVYFISGITYQIFFKHNSGKEIVPNSTFWFGLPGLIKDGFCLVFGTMRRRGYTPVK